MNTRVPANCRFLFFPLMVLLGFFFSALFYRNTFAAGTTYYVDSLWGDDGRTAIEAQNPSTPWKSISHAAASAPAGTEENANVIQVGSGTYSAVRTGESFPIRFQNDNIIIRGAGADGSVIDANFLEPLVMVLDATNITIEGFEIRDSTESLISSTVGGLNVQNNVLLHSPVGVAVSAHVTGTADTQIGFIRVAENAIDVTSNGVEIDVGLSGMDAAVDLALGPVEVLSNTIDLPNLNGVGIDFDDFYLDKLNGGTATIGQVDIRNNTITGGRFGLDMYGWIDNVNDATVAVGDVTIKGNQFQDQLLYAVLFDYYDLDYWSGASVGNLGKVVVEKNQIASDTAFGLIMEDFGFMSGFDNSRAMAGEVRITDNIIDTPQRQSMAFWISNVEFLDSGSAVTMSNISLSGNVVTGTIGIGLDLSLIEVINNDSSYNLGSISIDGNRINAYKGLLVDLNIVGLDLDGTSLGVSGPISVTNNIIDASGEAISFELNDVGEWLADQAEVRVGNVFIHNNVTSGDGDNLIVFLNDYNGYENQDDAHVTLPSWSIRDNRFYGAGKGIEYENGGNPMENIGNARIEWGGLEIAGNLLDGTSGVQVYMEDFGRYNYDESIVSLESIRVDDNQLLNTTGDAIKFWLSSYGQAYESETEITVGDLSINRNAISNTTGSGVVLDLSPYKSTYTTTVTWGDMTMSDNVFYNVAGAAVNIELDAQALDASSLTLGELVIDSNQIVECGAGLAITETATWDPAAVLNLGDLCIENNTILESYLGMDLETVRNTRVTNNVLGNNPDGGLILDAPNGAWLVHNTIASYQLESSDAIQVDAGIVAITNTIISHYETGIRNDGGLVGQDYNLFNNNSFDIAGAVDGGGHDLAGNPGFIDPAGGDFHLTAVSAAIDRGSDMGIEIDIDGDLRAAPPDVGADEFTGATLRIYLPLVMSKK
ncbi:MAG: hypothetical protein JXA42_14855 [Anaerolineales bacterium]|nr:hypothetical protein [Anaerolineales bacterium]